MRSCTSMAATGSSRWSGVIGSSTNPARQGGCPFGHVRQGDPAHVRAVDRLQLHVEAGGVR
jgi:hypothetical protein